MSNVLFHLCHLILSYLENTMLAFGDNNSAVKLFRKESGNNGEGNRSHRTLGIIVKMVALILPHQDFK